MLYLQCPTQSTDSRADLFVRWLANKLAHFIQIAVAINHWVGAMFRHPIVLLFVSLVA